ncbi:FAD-dependent oxidoreductase, partial [Streptomonospora algeriensis]
PEDEEAVRGEGVAVLRGRARFDSTRTVLAEGHEVAAHRVVIATGSEPLIPPVPGLADLDLLTSDNVFDLARLPASLAVLGGGPIGCELAQAFARLGAKATVVEAQSRLLPAGEPEASRVVEERFRTEGIDVRTGAEAVRAHTAGPRDRIDLAAGAPVTAERVLVAVGRSPDTAGLG